MVGSERGSGDRRSLSLSANARRKRRSWGSLKPLSRQRPPPLRTSKFVLVVTVKDACRGADFLAVAKDQSRRPPKGVNKKTGNWCRACSNSSRWAIGRSNARIGRHGWLDRPSRLRGHQNILRSMGLADVCCSGCGVRFRARVSSDNPRLNVFCRVAPSVALKSRLCS